MLKGSLKNPQLFADRANHFVASSAPPFPQGYQLLLSGGNCSPHNLFVSQWPAIQAYKKLLSCWEPNLLISYSANYSEMVGESFGFLVKSFTDN